MINIIVMFKNYLLNHSNLLVFGDVNFPDINWNNYSASNSVSSTFCDTIFHIVSD